MKVIYPGSFNPWHKGHQDILERALKLFKNVEIVVSVNPDKKLNCDFIKWTLAPLKEIKGVNIRVHKGLVAKLNAPIVRGVRNSIDLIYEQTLADWNAETVLLLTKPELGKISSSALRELYNYAPLRVGKYVGNKYIFLRWMQETIPEHTLYFGKIASGKSTYLKGNPALEEIVDCDDVIWDFVDIKEARDIVIKSKASPCTAIGKKFLSAYKEDKNSHVIDIFKIAVKYTDVELFMIAADAVGRSIDWYQLLSPYRSYEIAPLGCYWSYIPEDIIASFQLTKIKADPNIRAKFLKHRQISDEYVNMLDNKIYKDAPFWDNTVTIKNERWI